MIYHVTRRVDWLSALRQGVYRISSADQSIDAVGFIHASERHQVPGVIERYYQGVPDLVVLALDEEAIRASGVEVRREGTNGELFPHVYGSIDPAWVVAVEQPAHGAS